MTAVTRLPGVLVGVALMLLASCQAGQRRGAGGAGSGDTPPWTVMATVPRDQLAAASRLSGDGWTRFGQGYTIDARGGQAGRPAWRMVSPAPGQVRGAEATVVLGQRAPRPVYVSARSRADRVTGEPDPDYSLYVDLRHVDGSMSFGYALPFAVGSHDWQQRDGVIVPVRPVDRLTVYCLFRNRHTGTVWFDDVVVAEAPADALVLDGQLVRRVNLPAPGPTVAAVTIGEGMHLAVHQGGAVTVASGARPQPPTGALASLGGFFVRDVRARSDLVHPGGLIARPGEQHEQQQVVTQTASMPALGLGFSARMSGRSDRIDVHAELHDQAAAGARAVSLYFALPLPGRPSDWTWGDDVRRSRALADPQALQEHANLTREWDIGAVGAVSRYPFAAIWGPLGGLAVALPPDQPRVARLAAHPATGQLFVVFDLALSPDTARFPGRAWVDFSLYTFRPGRRVPGRPAGLSRSLPGGLRPAFPGRARGDLAALYRQAEDQPRGRFRFRRA